MDSMLNTIVCHPEEEDTMVTTQSMGWIEYILNQKQDIQYIVADIFSRYGMSINLYILGIQYNPEHYKYVQ